MQRVGLCSVVMVGEIEEQKEYDGSYATYILLDTGRFELRATGEAAKVLAAIRTGHKCICAGELVEEKWETERDGWRSKVYVKVSRAHGL